MCLGVPGRVQQWIDRDPLFARAIIQFDGVARECHMACVPEANVGDYVIVHAGVAICRLEEAEAARIFEELDRVDVLGSTAKDARPKE
ncbi:MAG: HypC/HybG/HupF family hydrogenase formation chaperone [Planctomycetales bacterium]|nr:HypC/HybG/HupF family hydrogenase formation chaperone [Planctomycetales bacterium]